MLAIVLCMFGLYIFSTHRPFFTKKNTNVAYNEKFFSYFFSSMCLGTERKPNDSCHE